MKSKLRFTVDLSDDAVLLLSDKPILCCFCGCILYCFIYNVKEFIMPRCLKQKVAQSVLH